jgi:putative ABC transport system permease protein
MATVYEYTHERNWRTMSLVVRTVGPPTSIAHAATAALHGIDPEQPVQDILSMDDVVDQTLTSQRFSAFILGLFAYLALALASIGICGLISALFTST